MKVLNTKQCFAFDVTDEAASYYPKKSKLLSRRFTFDEIKQKLHSLHVTYY